MVDDGAAGAADPLRFLDGGGELAALIRARDWSGSPLGPPADWPAVLKTTVSMILPAATQIVLFWGAEFVALYNDSYAPTIGDKHPHALGRPAREHWSELWDDLEPLLLAVRDRGETVAAEDRSFYIERHGHGETVYFDISYSPVRDESGAVLGVICLVKETTQQVLSRQRLEESEQRFRSMADSAPMPTWVTDRQGIEFANQAMTELFGLDADALRGAAWERLIHPDDLAPVQAIRKDAWDKQNAYRFEARFRRADGEWRWMHVNSRPRFDAGGALLGYVGMAMDVSDIHRAESELRQRQEQLNELVGALRQSEEGFRSMVESLPIPAWVTAESGGIHFANQAFSDFAGRAPDQLAGDQWKDLLRPQDLARYVEVRDRALASAAPFELEVQARRADGAWRRLLVSARPRALGAGGSFGYVGVAADLTDIREAEEALRESEERLRLAAEFAEVGFWDVDLINDILIWPPRTKAMFGIAADAPVSMTDFYRGLHPEDREPTSAAFAAAIDPGQRATYDVEYRTVGRDDGIIRWVAAKGRGLFDGDGRCVRVVGTALDITARKQAELALAQKSGELREQARNLETLNRVASEVSAELDLQRLVQMVTDEGVALTGAQFGAFFYNVLNEAGESYMLFSLSGARPDQFDFGMPRNTDVFHTTFSGEGVLRSDDITKDPRYGKNAPHFGKPKGHLPVVSYLAVPVISRSGEVIGGLFFGHEQPGRFTARHETLLVGIAAQAAVGMDNARLYEAAQKEITSREQAEQALRLLNETLEHRVADEVERRSAAEEALRQAQKMETLGQLTGGVAHDFNNLLQIVSGNLDLIQRGLPEDAGRLRRAADNAARGAERAAILTQRLLAFSRRQPLAPKPVEANRLVAGMSELLHRTLGETIAIETVLASGLWTIEVDPNQLENALLNLAVNARDAMAAKGDGGGKLTIETSNSHFDRAYAAENAGVLPGQYVCICVSDTGCGMDADTVTRAFEPFFTTKDVGKGTGLGLSMVYGFVKQSGGHLKIYSEVDQGTSVKVYLPRLTGPAPAAAEEAEAEAPEGSQNETILVCEDDEDVRAFTVEVLRDLGYRVLEASDGPAALRVLERADGEVDLLFTDVVLPGGMTGAVLAERARELRSHLKILFTTGYARNAIVHHGRLDPGVELITKPFSYTDLAARVRDMLDGTA